MNQARRPIFDVVVQEPALAQNTGPVRFDDLMTIHGQIDVVAHAAAEGTRGVFDQLQLSVRLAPSEMLVLMSVPNSGSRLAHATANSTYPCSSFATN